MGWGETHLFFSEPHNTHKKVTKRKKKKEKRNTAGSKEGFLTLRIPGPNSLIEDPGPPHPQGSRRHLAPPKPPFSAPAGLLCLGGRSLPYSAARASTTGPAPRGRPRPERAGTAASASRRPSSDPARGARGPAASAGRREQAGSKGAGQTPLGGAALAAVGT